MNLRPSETLGGGTVQKVGGRAVAGERQFFQCASEGQSFCLDIENILAIRRSDHLQRNPMPGREPLGWLLGEKDELAVFGLSHRLGEKGKTVPELGIRPVVELQDSSGRWGLLVDQLLPVLAVGAREIHALPALATLESSALVGVIPKEEHLIFYLDSGRLHAFDPEARQAEPAREEAPPLASSLGRDSGEPGATRRIVSFVPTGLESSGLRVGLSMTQVPQIIEPRELLPLPQAAPEARGLVNWRGTPVAVLDLAAFWGLGRSPGAGDRLLVARGFGHGLLAFPIARDVIHHGLPIRHRPSIWRPERNVSHLGGVFETETGKLMIPDLNSMTSSRPAAKA